MGYLTLDEFRSAPTAVDATNLAYGAAQGDQDAALARCIQRASDWADSYTTMQLGASTRTKTGRVTIARDGMLNLHPGDKPLVSLTSLQVGSQANQFSTVSDLAGAWIDEASFVVPVWSGVSTLGSLQFGTPRPGGRLLARYSFVAGYPCTTLTADTAVTASSLTVASTSGMVAGTQLVIVDGANTETVTVLAAPSSTTVTLAAPTVPAHVAGAGVHAMPEDLKEAIILLTTAFIQARGNDSLVMSQALQPGPPPGMDPVTVSSMKMAREILFNFRRMV